MRLKELAERVEALENLPLSNSDASLTDPRLQTICRECGWISTELLQRLHQLKVPDQSKHRKWKNFRQALKSVWSKREIDNMANRLSDLRSVLNTEMLNLLR
jgi:hypothetical protein